MAFLVALLWQDRTQRDAASAVLRENPQLTFIPPSGEEPDLGKGGRRGTIEACLGQPGWTREWRNWQTRMVEGHMPVRAWRFESSLAHFRMGSG